ncbi:hypothetical protein EDEG_02469 [Edhazardia aedis USNM 41457]|uniref:40S ribosomal protein S26 n=1 Tax=Edhazardia aedis (strain USNM 41457) TaxID=1003232 RepID=J9D6M2_EDHAE|nr:hypothetical protein EDEG_02469 [Edhazardia aedis USNM 41457]|eukprot:EJW03164.1 hypothetical protein EDEG_02469 [Edhazardia aedis USNM 41457]
MPVKRRNHGRAKKNRGHTDFQRCDNCHRACPKDKAIKRYQVRNVIEAAAADDLKLAILIENFEIPKSFDKSVLCISCAVHKRVVRSRSVEKRKLRGAAARAAN